jgi:hypothetical protein
MILIRYILLVIIGYLVIRAFVKFGEEERQGSDHSQNVNKNNNSQKKVSKEIGEYIDYEEIKEKKD